MWSPAADGETDALAGEPVSIQLYSYWKSVFDITKNINIGAYKLPVGQADRCQHDGVSETAI